MSKGRQRGALLALVGWVRESFYDIVSLPPLNIHAIFGKVDLADRACDDRLPDG